MKTANLNQISDQKLYRKLRSFLVSSSLLLGLSFSAEAASVDGYVFNDIDGMSDNRIHTNGTYTNNSGTNTYANGLGGTYAILYNSANIVVASVAVSTYGYYNFPNVAPGNYAVAINAYSGTVGSTIPQHILTPGWQLTGERLGRGTGHDGNVDGHSIFFKVSTSNVYDVNFGIRTTPTPNQDCYYNNPYMPTTVGTCRYCKWYNIYSS